MIERNNRRQTPALKRGAPSIPEKPKFLIVCEGKNTEPSYFNKFKLSTATIKAVGKGFNTKSLVEWAVELSKEDNYNQIWCVFDKDDCPDNDFNDAITNAENAGFKAAYSNQAFEYWILLHLKDHQGDPMHRNDYKVKINELLKPFNLTYDSDGRKLITDDIFEFLLGINQTESKTRQEIAINRAKRNYNKFDHKNRAREESSTTIFNLVEELNRYI